MQNLDNIFEKAMTAGKEIEKRKEAKTREMDMASEAVTAAAAEMEKAAIEGNETAYAKAKEKKNAAENRLEILQIRDRNKTTTTDWIKEAEPILNELKTNSLDEMRKMIMEFCSKDAELLQLIDSIDEYSKKYNHVLDYFKSYVFKDPNWHIQYMADLLPIAHVLDIKRKYSFQRSEIKKAINYK